MNTIAVLAVFFFVISLSLAAGAAGGWIVYRLLTPRPKAVRLVIEAGIPQEQPLTKKEPAP